MSTVHSNKNVTEADHLLSGLVGLPRRGEEAAQGRRAAPEPPPLLSSRCAARLGSRRLPQRIQLAIDRFPQLERIRLLIELLKARLVF